MSEEPGKASYEHIKAELNRFRAALEEIAQWEGKPRKIAERALAAEEKS